MLLTNPAVGALPQDAVTASFLPAACVADRPAACAPISPARPAVPATCGAPYEPAPKMASRVVLSDVPLRRTARHLAGSSQYGFWTSLGVKNVIQRLRTFNRSTDGQFVEQ